MGFGVKHEQLEQAVSVSKAMIYGGSGTTFGAKLWAWLGANSEQITSLCSILGAIICVAGFALNIYVTKYRDRDGD
ncbi:MAG: hypothetical protein ABJM39_11840 [Porticoccus sp.]|uniref:hypothetical protein n=1 Tax=Porticoccus sp. TaxID=2024853 RepID=UPI003298B5BC